MNVVLIGFWLLAQASPAGRIPLENFEKDAPGWAFIGGEEFPGARGSLSQSAFLKKCSLDPPGAFQESPAK